MTDADPTISRKAAPTMTTPPTPTTPAQAGREHWRRVLTGGGSTAIPRWTPDPTPGTAVLDMPLPSDAVARCTGPGGSTTLLAAHARVLAALSGESEVITGYRLDGTAVLPLRLSADTGSWRDLLRAAHRAESELLAHREADADDVRRDLGLPTMPFETALTPAGDGGEPGDGVVLTIGLVDAREGDPDGTRPVLRLRYRTDVLDADCAGRIAGYHLAALGGIAADPDADPRSTPLLSADEVRLQIDGMSGPVRELPDLRFHELFERQASLHPDAVAAEQGERRWTYRELNARANRLGRALLARGLRAEDPVAVVTERNLDWMAAVIAVFKAGGAYLPIEPHFPSDRIATTLARAGCRFVVTEMGSTDTLDPALDTLAVRHDSDVITTLLVSDREVTTRAASDIGVAVGPDQLAYIYFTSGSTGQPKGAMCEHAGMLNHLLAKIEDLGVGEGQAVAQTAPQCFDISLWQLISALLVGGRTVLVEQDLILDVARYLDRLAKARVNVLQVVPSYLEVVLSYLDAHPRELPDLHTVSTTGEALKAELAARWFAARPGVRLANVYGLTETSDDFTHEVMDRVPASGRISLGPAIRNVAVYVVDADLQPVPLGAPGEIVCAGVCVGRGYVNDPERTAAAFTTDPHHPGRRLYRSGDHGRWLPGGTLEFLGRRDAQVKIRGFRIEIGEIENTLARAPGVRDGAVVVHERTDGSKHLVAFYAAAAPIGDDVLAAHLGASLPVYMVPTAFHRLDRLPLTANSKIDTKALTALAGEMATSGAVHEAPVTATEQRVAAAWASVLGVPVDEIGRRASFVDLGGTSLSAVKVAIALDRVVPLKELVRTTDLADLAEVVDAHTTDLLASDASTDREGT